MMVKSALSPTPWTGTRLSAFAAFSMPSRPALGDCLMKRVMEPREMSQCGPTTISVSVGSSGMMPIFGLIPYACLELLAGEHRACVGPACLRGKLGEAHDDA